MLLRAYWTQGTLLNDSLLARPGIEIAETNHIGRLTDYTDYHNRWVGKDLIHPIVLMMNGLQIYPKGQQLYGFLSHRKPSVCSKKNLYGCKSYVLCGRAQNLKFYDESSDFCLLKIHRCGSWNSFVVLFWFCIFLYYAVKCWSGKCGLLMLMSMW